jgi:hypothetical protein
VWGPKTCTTNRLTTLPLSRAREGYRLNQCKHRHYCQDITVLSGYYRTAEGALLHMWQENDAKPNHEKTRRRRGHEDGDDEGVSGRYPPVLSGA